MRLRPITDEELPDFIETSRQRYAEQKHAMGGMSHKEALEEAAAETEQLFPDGKLTPGHAVLFAVDDDNQTVGRLWIAPRGDSTEVAFIYAIEVEPAARGKGYGRALMNAAKEWSLENGYRTVKLHVFGGNDGAIALYRSLGYTVTDLTMQLRL